MPIQQLIDNFRGYRLGPGTDREKRNTITQFPGPGAVRSQRLTQELSDQFTQGPFLSDGRRSWHSEVRMRANRIV